MSERQPRLKWTLDEKSWLHHYVVAGKSAAEISLLIRRSRSAVLNMCHRQGLRLGGGANWKRVPYRKIGRGRIAL